MLEAALRFRSAKPWELIDDSMIFAVRLSDGETGYCCVMGNGGEHYGISMYKGRNGFGTYLTTISGIYNNPFLSFTNYRCINCDFENATDLRLDKAEKELIKKVAQQSGLKISRPKGYPEIIKYDKGHLYTTLDEQSEKDIVTCLKAGIEVNNILRKTPSAEWESMSLSPMRGYPSPNGGTTIPYLIPHEDGNYTWETTETPPLEEEEDPEIEFNNNELIADLKALKKVGIYCCRLTSIPMPITTDYGMYYPQVLIVVRKMDGFMIPVMNDSDSISEFPESFGDTLINLGTIPATIEVSDAETKNLLADFCKKSDIRLSTVSSMPMIDEALDAILSFMG